MVKNLMQEEIKKLKKTISKAKIEAFNVEQDNRSTADDIYDAYTVVKMYERTLAKVLNWK